MNTTLRKFSFSFLLFLVISFAAAETASASAPAFQDEFVISYGSPHSTGKFVTKLEITYEDGKGKKHTIKIEAVVKMGSGQMSAEAKRGAVQDALQDELDKEENKPGGQGAITLSGGGATLILDPTTINLPNGSGGMVACPMKIKKVKHTDGTGQRDKIRKPTGNAILGAGHSSLAIISATGSLTGKNSGSYSGPDTPATFSITTDLGTTTTTIFGDMTKVDLLDLLAKDLSELGFTVWSNSSGIEPQLFVLVDDTVGGIGATTTDDGLYAVLEFIGPE